MWVVLRGGHVCAVAQDQLDASKTCVRFWNAEDMQAARKSGLDGRCVGPLNSDYPYRIVCEPYEAASWLAQQVYDIDYQKFKPTVDHGKKGGDIRARVLLDMFCLCWDHLRDEPVRAAGLRRPMTKGAKAKVRSWLDKPERVEEWSNIMM